MAKINLTCSVCNTTREVVRRSTTPDTAPFWCVECQRSQLLVAENKDELLKQANNQLPNGYKIVLAEDDSFKLLKIDEIETEDGTEDEWIATVYDMGSFTRFIAENKEK